MAKTVTCKRCNKAYEPNNYEICDACVSELEYQAQYDEEVYQEAQWAEREAERQREETEW